MDNLTKLDKLIREVQGIDQPAPSRTWRKETAKCEKCSADYEARIMSVDGKDQEFNKDCPACTKIQRAQEERAKLEAQLKNAAEQQRALWRDQCGVPGVFREKTFDNFERKLQPKAFAAIEKYAEEREYECFEVDKPPRSLVLLSESVYGVGKTHLVCALINHAISTGIPAWIDKFSVLRHGRCPAYFATEMQLLARIRATYNQQRGAAAETEEDIYRALENFPLLVIDDVGKVRPRDPSFLQGVYFRVLDSRYVNQQPIVLTTNLNYTELEEHIGGACADRLVEMCGNNFIKMAGKSYRGKRA